MVATGAIEIHRPLYKVCDRTIVDFKSLVHSQQEKAMLIETVTKVMPKSSQENLKGQIKWVLLEKNLIIGDFMDHGYMVMEALHPDLDFLAAMDKVDGYRDRVIASGIVTKDGEMVGWESTGLGVKTPFHLKQELSLKVKEVVVKERDWRK